jgi:hypothetical protein
MFAHSIACLFVFAVGSTGGDEPDLRDVVVLTSGAELTGRVVRPHAADTIELVQGDELRVIQRSDVLRTSTVEERLASWLELATPGLPVAREWELVLAADAAQLHAIARLQAHRVLLLEPDHAGAHAFLGHEGKPGKWKWLLDERHVSHDKWLAATTDEDDPLAFTSEHWSVRCDGGLLRTLQIAFDLERLYVAWNADFGAYVDARTVREPMIARVHARHEDFRPLSSVGLPYYDPGHLLGSTNSYDSAFYTWYEPAAARPERLFDLATQQLIYTAVLGEKLRTVPRDTTEHREAACLEVGLGDWFERRVNGSPGFAEFGAWRPDKLAAELALSRARTRPLDVHRHELTNLVHVSWGRLAQTKDENEVYWAKCRTFIAFLMENGATLPVGAAGGTRTSVFALTRTIYGVPTGNTSTAWDEALAPAKLEELEVAWKQWLMLLP